MFDLLELHRAETALREIRGQAPRPDPEPRARPDLSRCPFHNASPRTEQAA